MSIQTYKNQQSRACIGLARSIRSFGLAVSCLGIVCSVNAQAATVIATAPSVSSTETSALRQALDDAWQLSPHARTESSRRSELLAKRAAAHHWVSGEPSVSLAHRTDRLTRNDGFREYEAEIELPLWNPGVRAATQAELVELQQQLETNLAHHKLKLAGELRTLAAAAATAQVELNLNQRKLLELTQLETDVSRRVKAGENARIDSLYAQVQIQQAQAAMAQAESQLSRLQNQWRSLTGQASFAVMDEQSANPATLDTPIVPSHPTLQYAQAQLNSARAKLNLAQADQRDPMSLGVGVSRERGAFASANDTKLRVALRIPLGGDNRNAPRIAAARAELDTALAEVDTTQRQLQAEAAAATAELRAARTALAAAQVRVRLSTEVQTLITQSWRLGESDLPTRLRADNELFEASLSQSRATIDVQRAIANLNQAQGTLP